SDVAEEAQRPPNSLRFETTAVAEREVGDMIPQHVAGNNYGAAGRLTNKSHAVCRVNARHEALQSAVRFSGLQLLRADAWYVNECIVQHKYITVLHVGRYSAAAGYEVRLDGSASEQAALSEVICEFYFPQIRSDFRLRESQVSRESRSGIVRLGLE